MTIESIVRVLEMQRDIVQRNLRKKNHSLCFRKQWLKEVATKYDGWQLQILL